MAQQISHEALLELAETHARMVVEAAGPDVLNEQAANRVFREVRSAIIRSFEFNNAVSE